MTKHDHILHWKETAEEDWLGAQALFQAKRFLLCLFAAHLTIEKLSKAHWVKTTQIIIRRARIIS